MRYRIVKEANGLGECFYEVHFYKQVPVALIFKRWKWVPVIEHERRADWWFSRTARYDTLEEAQKIVDKNNTKRTLESMGEVHRDPAYTAEGSV